MLKNDFAANLRRLTLGFWCSKTELELLAADILKRPGRMQKLIELMIKGEPQTQGQAARILWLIGKNQPARLQPYKASLIDEVAGVDHWIVRTSLCRVIPALKLTAQETRAAIGIFIGYLDDEHSVVKTCVMQALADLTIVNPDLRGELMPIIESLMHTGTPAMRARGRQLHKKFDQFENRRRVRDRDS